MPREEARLCLLLQAVAGIEDAALTRLLLHCGSPGALAAGGPARWLEAGLSPGQAGELQQVLLHGSARIDTDAQLAALAAAGAEVLPVTDVRYPPLLRAIHDPPPLLYARGDVDLLCHPQLAVVGSRRASAAGLKAAGALAGDAVDAGLNITSGLARGIDGAAHRGALERGGGSIAVMATGIDRLYPAQHRRLADELVRAGCLVTEFPPGVPPLPANFPRRNRIISGLSLGVLVVEAALPSGSLISARTALEQGREVFALPWSIYHAGGQGCLHLVRDGAKMVQTIGDVLEELGPLYALQQDLPSPRRAGQAGLELSGRQQRVLELVGYERVAVDELSQLSALPVAVVLAELSFLEMQGAVCRAEGGYIRR
jgi:DNA processing protein